ncbi:tetratricopeptide repeat protein [Pseudomonas spirodelae]|uniref:Tetratricopeptide repeat protein n=1 Tax=Pseudomonas spirodelae TaxID=3101751 RepID=A0ABU5PCW6_9PSED|nr:tetratricopeptide repeat protein [Pseudomonas sp. T5W1]MEA1607454.1 tetratricopeptide repeat protein [Pseudomonas sp. T5W1]
MAILRGTAAITTAELTQMLSGTPSQRARAILAAASTGHPDAQVMLGQILLQGQGIERDAQLALVWFRIAAAQQNAMAYNMLGRCHEHGWAVPADPTLAAEHYQHAADQALDWGLYNLANLLATGRGVKQDLERAFSLYLQAAQAGHAKSMNLSGRCYEDGLGVEADARKALYWYQCAAAAGDFRGQYSLAAVLAAQGQIADAEQWLRQALTGGNLNFLRSTRAALLQTAQPSIRALAIDYHRRAAELGSPDDQACYAALTT